MAYSRTYPEIVRFPKIERRSPSVVYDYSFNVNFTGSRSGSKVPDYKEKIRLGQQASSAYTLDRSKIVKSEPGEATASYRAGLYPFDSRWESIYGFGFTPTPNPTHLAVSIGTAESIALTKTYKKVQSELQHMNSPAFFAEIFDVLRQFGKPADAIIDLTNRHLNRLELERRGLKGSVSFRKIKWAEVVASTYLEYAFGLKPLISDTQKAAEALARFNTEEELHKFRKRIVSRHSVVNRSSSYDKTNGFGGSRITFGRMQTKETEGRCQYVVGLDAPPIAAYGSNDRLLQLLGFTPENWVPAIWEAIPWSWLIDYFTNVSEILEASVASTASVKWICKTVSHRTKQIDKTDVGHDKVTWGSLDKNKQFSGTHAGYVESVRTTVSRTLPLSLGVPPLYLEHPFDNPMKIANMAAVLFARKPSNSALWLF